MLRKHTLLAAAVAATLAAPVAQATNGYFAHGYGTKSKALAGGGVALPQDAMISATNPAGLAWVGTRMDVGASLFSPRREFKASDVPQIPFDPPGGSLPGFPLEPGKTESDSDWFLIPHFAYNRALDEQSSFGVSVYGNGGMNTDYGKDPVSAARGQAVDRFVATMLPPQGNPFDPPVSGTCAPGVFCAGTSGVNLSQLFVNLSYARKFNDRASWGAGLVLAGQGFRAKGLGFFSGFSNSPSNLTDNGHDFSFGAGVKVGLQGEVIDGLTLAGSYQSKIWMSDFDDYEGLFADGGNFDIPPTATIGLAWNVAPQHTIVADYQYIWYENVDSISNPNRLDLCMAGQTQYCLGGSKGAGFGWENTGIIKVGWQFDYNPDLTFRLGFSHNDQPIKSSQVLFNTLAPGVVENHFTAGLTQRLGKNNEWSLMLMYAPEKSIKGPNSFTGAAPDQLGPGSPAIPGQEIEISMKQFEVEASFGMTWD
jgi:long-chain fatty acid transport protein